MRQRIVLSLVLVLWFCFTVFRNSEDPFCSGRRSGRITVPRRLPSLPHVPACQIAKRSPRPYGPAREIVTRRYTASRCAESPLCSSSIIRKMRRICQIVNLFDSLLKQVPSSTWKVPSVRQYAVQCRTVSFADTVRLRCTA